LETPSTENLEVLLLTERRIAQRFEDAGAGQKSGASPDSKKKAQASHIACSSPERAQCAPKATFRPQQEFSASKAEIS
jgi:hypothetical protein